MRDTFFSLVHHEWIRDRDWLKKRIHQILQARKRQGNPLTGVKIGKKMNLATSTVSALLKVSGSREIKFDEAIQLAALLGMSVERLAELDTQPLIQELEQLTHTLSDAERFLRQAKTYYEMAVEGTTEEFKALTYLAYAYLGSGDQKHAQLCWQRAFDVVQGIDYVDDEDFARAGIHVVRGAFEIGQYERMLEQAQEIEKQFQARGLTCLVSFGQLNQYRAQAYDRLHEFEQARFYFVEAVNLFRISTRRDLVASTYQELSLLHLRQQDLEEALSYLELSRDYFIGNEPLLQTISDLHYAKILLLLGRQQEAVEVAAAGLARVRSSLQRQDLEAKLMILMALGTEQYDQLDRIYEFADLDERLIHYVALTLAYHSCPHSEAASRNTRKHLDFLMRRLPNPIVAEWF